MCHANQQCAACSHYWKCWTDVGITISDMESKFVMQASCLYYSISRCTAEGLVCTNILFWSLASVFQSFIEAFQNFYYVWCSWRNGFKNTASILKTCTIAANLLGLEYTKVHWLQSLYTEFHFLKSFWSYGYLVWFVFLFLLWASLDTWPMNNSLLGFMTLTTPTH